MEGGPWSGPSTKPSGSDQDANPTPTRGDAYVLTAGYVAALPQLPDPRGTVPDIALRFITALQAERWADAAAQLSLYTRNLLSFHQPEDVQAVLADVRQHAGGDQLGACTSSRILTDEAAVVHCGQKQVVVHVDVRLLPGVQISAEHPRTDVLGEPHAHAYTGRQL